MHAQRDKSQHKKVQHHDDKESMASSLEKIHVHQFFPLFNQKKLGTINYNLRSLFSHNHSSEVTLLAIQIFVTYYGIAMHVVAYFLSVACFQDV